MGMHDLGACAFPLFGETGKADSARVFAGSFGSTNRRGSVDATAIATAASWVECTFEHAAG